MIYLQKNSVSKRMLSVLLSVLMVFSAFSMLTSVAGLKTDAADYTVSYATYVAGPFVIRNSYVGFGYQYLYDSTDNNNYTGAEDGNNGSDNTAYINYGRALRNVSSTDNTAAVSENINYMWNIYSYTIGGNTHYMLRNLGTGRYMHTGAYTDYYSYNNDNNSLNMFEWNATNVNGATGIDGASNPNRELSYYMFDFKVAAADGATPTSQANVAVNADGFTAQIMNQRFAWGQRVLHGELAGDHNTTERAGRVFFTSNTYGWGTKSFLFTPVSGPSTIDAPTNVAATATGSASIALTWNAVTDATGYTVFRSTSASGPFTQVDTSSTNSYTDTGLSSATTYYYRVTATDGTDTSSTSAVVNATTQEAVPQLSISSYTDSQINLSWTYAGGDTPTYAIFKSTDGITYSQLTTVPTNSYTDTAVSAGNTYYYKVAVQVDANETFTVGAMDYFGTNEANPQNDKTSATNNAFRRDTQQSDGLYNAGYIDNGEWAGYTINPAYSGTYSVTMYQAANDANQHLSVIRSGSSTGAVIAETTFTGQSNWQAYAQNTYNANLTAGSQNIFYVAGGSLNLWKMVFSINTTTNGTLSNAASQTLAVQTIDAPTNVAATANGYNAINVSWTAVTDATGYTIYRSTSENGTYAQAGTSATNSFADSGLTAGTRYYYYVTASNASSTSANSAKANATTATFGVATASVGSATTKSLTVSWNAVADATAYNVYRSTSSGGSYTEIASNATSPYVDNNLDSNTTYYYKVETTDGTNTTQSAVANGTTTALVAPVVTVTNPTTTALTINWTSVTIATTYNVYRSTTVGGTYTMVSENATSPYENTGLTVDTTYYYKVEATDGRNTIQSTAVSGTTTSATVYGDLFDDYSGTIYYIRNSGLHRFGDSEPNASVYMGFNARAFVYDSTAETELLKIGSNSINAIDGLTGGRTARKATYDNAGVTATYNYPEGDVDSTSVYFDNFKWMIVSFNGGYIFKNITTGRYLYTSNNAETPAAGYSAVYTVAEAPNSLNVDNYTFTFDTNATTTALANDATGALTNAGTTTYLTNKATGKCLTIQDSRNALHDTYINAESTSTVTTGTYGKFNLIPAVTSVALATPSVSAAASGITSNNVSWSDVTGSSSLELYTSTNGVDWSSAIDVTGTNSYNHTGLNSNTIYYYKLVASDSIYTTEGTASATTNAAVPVLSITEATNSHIDLSWTYEGTDSPDFVIYRSTDGTNFSQLITTNERTYSDTTVVPDNTYYYRVSTTSAMGETITVGGMDYVSRVDVDSFRQDTLQSDGLYNAGYIGDGDWAQYSITPSFTGTYNVTVYQASNNTAVHNITLRTGSASGTILASPTFTANGDWQGYVPTEVTVQLTAGQQSFYYVSHNEVNLWKMVFTFDATGLGTDSNVVSRTLVSFPAPTDVSASANGYTAANISWTAVDNATGYTVYRCTTEDGVYTPVGTTATNSFADTELTDGTQYFYYVTATDGTNVSAASAKANTTTPAIPLPELPQYIATGDNLNRTDFADFPMDSNISYTATNCGVINAGVMDLNYTSTSIFGEKFELDYSMTTPKYLVIKMKGAQGGEETGLSISDEYDYSAALTNNVPFANLVTLMGNGVTVDTSWQYVIIDIAASGLEFAKDTTHETLSYDLWLLFSEAGSISIDDIFFTNSVVTDTSTTSTEGISIEWPAFANATSYKVFRGTTPAVSSFTQLGTTNETSFDDTTATDDAEYYYAVVGTNSAGDSPMAVSEMLTTGLANPRNMVASPVSISAIDVSWDAVEDATSYNLYVSTDGVQWTEEATGLVAENGTVSYSDTNLEQLTTYYYKAVSVNATETSSGRIVQATTYGIPTRPATFIATTAGGSSIDLTWTAPNHVATSTYAIYRGSSAEMTDKVLISDHITGLSYLDTGLEPDTDYYYQIYAVNPVGDYSTGFRQSMATTSGALIEPTTLTATAQSSSVVSLAWSGAINASSYRVDISTNGTNFTTLARGVTGETYSATRLDAETQYYFRVYAEDAHGSYSDGYATANATTTAAPNTSVTALTNASVNLTTDEAFTASATVTNNGLGVQDQTYIVTFTVTNGIITLSQSVAVTEDLAAGASTTVTSTFVSPYFSGTYDMTAAIGSATPATATLTVTNGEEPDTDPAIPDGSGGSGGSGGGYSAPTYAGLSFVGGPYYIHNGHYVNEYLYDDQLNNTYAETNYAGGSESDGTSYTNIGHLLHTNPSAGATSALDDGSTFTNTVHGNDQYMWLIYSKTIGANTYYVIVNKASGRAFHTGVFGDYYATDGNNNSANTYAWNSALENIGAIDGTSNDTKELSYYMHTLTNVNPDADFTTTITSNRWAWGGRAIHAEHTNATGFTFYTDNNYGWGTKNWVFMRETDITPGSGSTPTGVDLTVSILNMYDLGTIDSYDVANATLLEADVINVGDVLGAEVEIINNGTSTLASGSKIEFKCKLDTDYYRNSITLTEDLAPGASISAMGIIPVVRAETNATFSVTVNPKYGTASSEYGDIIEESNYNNNEGRYSRHYITAITQDVTQITVGDLSLTYDGYTDTYSEANPLYINEGESFVVTVPITNDANATAYNAYVSINIGDKAFTKVVSIAPGETIGVPIVVTPDAATTAQRISAIVTHNDSTVGGNANSFVFVNAVPDLSIVSVSPNVAYTGYGLTFLATLADNSSAPYTGDIAVVLHFDANHDGDYTDEGETVNLNRFMENGQSEIFYEYSQNLQTSDIGSYNYYVEVSTIEGEQVLSNNVSDIQTLIVYNSTVYPFTIRNRYNFPSANSANDGTSKFNMYIYDNVYATNAATHDAALVRFAGATTEQYDVSGYTNISYYNPGDAVTNGSMYTTLANGPTIETHPEYYWYYDAATGGIRNYATGSYLTRGTEVYQLEGAATNIYSNINKCVLTPNFVPGDSEWFYYRDPYYTYSYTDSDNETVTDGNYFIVGSQLAGLDIGDTFSEDKGIFATSKVLSIEYQWDTTALNYPDLNNAGEGVVVKATYVDDIPNAVDGANKYWVQYEGPAWYLDFEAATTAGDNPEIERKEYQVQTAAITKSNTVGSGASSQRKVSLTGGNTTILDPTPVGGVATVTAGGATTVTANNVLGYTFQGWYGYRTANLAGGVMSDEYITTIMDNTEGVGGSSIYYLGNEKTLTVSDLYYNYTLIAYFERTIYNVRFDVDINSNYSLTDLTAQERADYTMSVYDPTTGSHKSPNSNVKMRDKYLGTAYTQNSYYPLSEPLGYIEKVGDADYHTSVAIDRDVIYEYPMGSVVTVNATYDSDIFKFIGWKDMLSGVLVSTSETYSFPVGTDIYLMALYADSDASVDADVAGTGSTLDDYLSVYYVDNMTKKVHYVDKQIALTGGTTTYGGDTPALVGYDFVGWFYDEAGTQAVDFTNDIFNYNTLVYGCYQKSAETYDITVVNQYGDGTTYTLADKEFNHAFRMTAPAQDQYYQNFSYWEYGPTNGTKTIISTNKAVEVITLMTDTTLRAVFGAPAGSYPTAPITRTAAVYKTGTNVWSTCTSSLDTSKYTFVEKGVLIMTTQSNTKPSEDDFYVDLYLQGLDANGCGVVRGRSSSSYSMYSLRKTNINPNLYYWARAYLIYQNKATGAVVTTYGTILAPTTID